MTASLRKLLQGYQGGARDGAVTSAISSWEIGSVLSLPLVKAGSTQNRDRAAWGMLSSGWGTVLDSPSMNWTLLTTDIARNAMFRGVVPGARQAFLLIAPSSLARL